MRMNLSELEIRILGCLMEKELSTPEYYPLTLNALGAACNQKSNRDPVLSLTEEDVQKGLEALSARGLARLTTTGGRVPKYVHSVSEKLGLGAPERAILAELMLRGPQTAAELRSRGERMAEMGATEAVEEILQQLQQHGPALVARLPRQAGRKEQRYLQLFAGMPELPESAAEEERSAEDGRTERPKGGGSRLVELEGEVGELRQEVAALRREVEELIAALS